jgi:hypothetical protein
MWNQEFNGSTASLVLKQSVGANIMRHLLGVPLFVLMPWGSCDFIISIVCDVHTLSYI